MKSTDKQGAEFRAQDKAPLTDRVNSEPPIINGMSSGEANYIGAASMLVSILIGILLYWITDIWVIPFLLCIIGPMLCLWYGSLYLQKVKRGRPEGFYLHAMHLFFAARKLVKAKFILHHGYYELGCRLYLDLSRPTISTDKKKHEQQKTS